MMNNFFKEIDTFFDYIDSGDNEILTYLDELFPNPKLCFSSSVK